MFGSVKPFDKDIFRDDTRQSRWSRPKIKMIRQGLPVVEEERDAKVADLIQKGTKITQDYEEMMRQQLFIHQDIAQKHDEITKKGRTKLCSI
jgi:hypothetical protein